jgi:hypothetical protein
LHLDRGKYEERLYGRPPGYILTSSLQQNERTHISLTFIDNHNITGQKRNSFCESSYESEFIPNSFRVQEEFCYYVLSFVTSVTDRRSRYNTKGTCTSESSMFVQGNSGHNQAVSHETSLDFNLEYPERWQPQIILYYFLNVLMLLEQTCGQVP